MITKIALRAMRAHAEAEYPKEACGFLVRGVDMEVTYRPAKNVSPTPEAKFEVDPLEAFAVEGEGEVLAIVHSHPEGPDGPSTADRVACDMGSIPWYIVPVYLRGGSPRADAAIGIAPSETRAPLMVRPFVHGVLDCYTLVRDWFKRERGVELPDHPRSDEWWLKGGNLYVDNLAADGWRVLDESEALKPGDMILMQIGSPVPNHAALYLDDEQLSEGGYMHPMKGAMIHHMHGRPSERALYGGMYKYCTALVARHKSQE
ncbi:C40 family peptidase [Achromobacter sp. D10]|uniref:C40 family peptidase n=1 Tax=Achromobacter sp. D10 TaxID=3110765 RepID=UPI002B48F45D|nr:C40 family peptidase [Achromobacter sp. D10]MEB3098843.1 C40 family peptidase [Achromobacter sp. D10]